jgi:iron complex outermembrane receptor protein
MKTTSNRSLRFKKLPLCAALALGHSLTWAQAAPQGASTLPEVNIKAKTPASDRLITQQRPASVGKSAASVQDTPSSVTVIDVEQIRETGAKNIQESLQYSAGVYTGRFGFDTRGDWAAVRGLSPSNYIDGLRGLFGFYNNVRPEIYTLESVEVLKGPSSAHYGQADLGGIVNVVTKKPQKVAARELDLQLGSYERKQLAADVTGPLNQSKSWLYRLVALKRDSNTQVDYVNDDAQLLMPSLSWQPNADTRLTALFIHQQNDTKVSSQFLPYKGTLGDAPLGRIPSSRFAGEPGWDRYEMRKNEFSLFLDQRISQNWKLAATARQTKSSSVTREIWATVGAIPTDAGNITRTVHSADRKTDVLAADLRLQGQVKLGPTQHELAVGLDYQDAFWEEYNSLSQSGVGNLNLYQPVYGNVGTLNLNALPTTDRPDNKIVQTGLYVTDHISWGPAVVSLAVRHDQARNEVLNPTTPNTVVRNSATTGRLGLMYRFDNGLSPYASISDAFSPNLGTDGTPGAGYLKPTTGQQTEVGAKYLSASGNTSAAIAWFDIEQKNRVVDGATPGGREQIGSTTKGWELEARHRAGGLELLGNYTQLDAVNAVTDKRLSSIAEKTASAWTQYKFASGWRVGLGARYIGDVTGNAGTPVLPSVSLMDAMVGYSNGPWDVRLDVKNVADKEYVSWCRGANQDCGYGERLNAALNVRYRF